MQNAFAALGEESDDDDDDVQTVITQMATLTTQCQLTDTTTAETQSAVAAAINQLVANQQAMQQQFTAFTTQQNTTYQTRTPAPPITQFTIPNLATSPFEEREAVNVPENVDVVDVQTLRPQEDAIHAHRLPTSLPVKADCLKLVQVEDAVVAWPHLHSKPQPATRPQCTQTYSRYMRIGTYVFHAALTLRMGIL